MPPPQQPSQGALTSVSEYFDTLETRRSDVRDRSQIADLRRQLTYAKDRVPAYSTLLAGIDPRDITSRRALARLPVMRKSMLAELQKRTPPFGQLTATGEGASPRRPRLVFSSPGATYEPEGSSPDYWRLARALFAAGFREGHVVHNCFSYHFTPGGAMLESGAHALGCTVFRGGVGQTEQQVEAMAHLAPDGYVGTPSFLKIILDKADELDVQLTSLRRALVSGEAFPPSLRTVLAARGIAARQVYASADVGSIAYESPSAEGDGLIVDEGVIVELVRPGTGDPVGVSEVGEVVVTMLHNADYPLIRLATGDLSAVLDGESPCGRTNMRIKGWLGRADQTTKIKGMFVHPAQIDAIVKRHPELVKARLVVDNPDGVDRMVLHVELGGAANVDRESVIATLRDVTKLRGDVAVHAKGHLANDGKVIEDTRKYV
jgi:phenylacetate-CoA ligase